MGCKFLRFCKDKSSKKRVCWKTVEEGEKFAYPEQIDIIKLGSVFD